MSLASRRCLFATALGGPLALTGRRKSAAADRKLRFGYQRSSMLLTILKKHQILKKTLGPKGYQIGWSLFGVLEPMNAGSTLGREVTADAERAFTLPARTEQLARRSLSSAQPV